MDVIKQFKGNLIGVDTSIFIYFIEGNPTYSKFTNDFFLKNQKGEFNIITSVITLLEVLILPYRNSRDDLIKEYKAIFEESRGIDLVDLTPEISEISAKLRADYRIRTPDSIELGTAIYGGADYFLTNDIRLEAIKEIPIIVLNKIIQLKHISRPF
ncbi:MAG TPA: PIN domain-containing protein [Candidatus Kapabacteria bacterium]|nr:PIN domain-containing protein [Candidatus Kapabacteria bacterium]